MLKIKTRNREFPPTTKSESRRHYRGRGSKGGFRCRVRLSTKHMIHVREEDLICLPKIRLPNPARTPRNALNAPNTNFHAVPLAFLAPCLSF